MIAVSTIDGVLRVVVEVKIPSAAGGQWSEARIAKLIETIQLTVEAAEMVDSETNSTKWTPETWQRPSVIQGSLR